LALEIHQQKNRPMVRAGLFPREQHSGSALGILQITDAVVAPT
jgi:hypothetical protein